MRRDQASRVIRAPHRRVFEAFVNEAAIARWLPPAGARAIIKEFDPRPGGAFKMTLVFDGAGRTKGKTTRNSDTVEGSFVSVIAPKLIEQEFTFVSEDPQFAGRLLVTWRLEEESDGTRVNVTATNVPAGIKVEDHRAGIASSLSNLAAYLETNEG